MGLSNGKFYFYFLLYYFIFPLLMYSKFSLDQRRLIMDDFNVILLNEVFRWQDTKWTIGFSFISRRYLKHPKKLSLKRLKT